MLRICIAMIAIHLGIAGNAAQAQTPDVEVKIRYSRDYTRCMDRSGGVTPAMIECSSRETARWDDRLNTVYRAIMANRGVSERAKSQLRDAQRAWIAYREKACIAAGDLVAEGGSMGRIVGNECFLRMTAQRAVELETLANRDP